MANKRKKKKKKSWPKALLIYVFFPVLVWAAAFFIWFHWSDLTVLFGKDPGRAKPAAKADRDDVPRRATTEDSQETISEEDRRQLEEILKRK